MSVDELFHETLILRSAFDEFATYCCRNQTVEGCDLDELLSGMERLGMGRCAALLYAHEHAESIDAACPLVAEVLAWARDGRRPRAMKDAVGANEYRRIQRAFARAAER